MARPASKAWPTFTFDRAIVRLRPSPGAPIRPVITTIESASMIVWLIPSPIARMASGSWTLLRTWRSVEPSERAASTLVPGTPRIPSEVIRTAGGIA
jgi:hypothetical protein